MPRLPDKAFNVGDIVWYAIPENSEPGIILECMYYESISKWRYEVSFGHDFDSHIYEEIELSNTKRLV